MQFLSSVFRLSNLTVFYEAFRTAFGGVEWFLLAYIICLIAFFIIGKDYMNCGFVYPFAFMLLTIFNPFLIIPLAEMIGLLPRLRRLFWLLPVNLTLAFVFTWAVFAPWKKHWRALAGVCISVWVIVCGSFAVPHMHMLENPYKTSNMIIEFSQMIEADSAEHDLWKSVLFSDVELLDLHQYNPSIHSVLRRNELLDWSVDPEDTQAVKRVRRGKHILRKLALVSRYGIELKPSYFLKYIRRTRVHYVITEPGRDLDAYLTGVGFEQIGNVNGYRLYRILDPEQDE